MNLNFLKKLYYKSPYFLKKIFSFIPFDIRNGYDYRKWRIILNSKNHIFPDPMTSYKYAIENFQFYKIKYSNKIFNNWVDIPMLTKDEIQYGIDEFKNSNIPKFFVTTGGVTGKPAIFYQSNNIWGKELAFVYDYFERNGYKPSDLKASFRGGDFSNLKANKFWLFYPLYNEIHFSPFHLNYKTVSLYINKLNDLCPKFFHGYPSFFISLANFMMINNLKLNYNPTCIFLISEVFTNKDIIFLKSIFKCKISSFYGHTERLIFAEIDENLENFKPNLLYGYVELIDINGKIIEDNNIIGELVATSYDNFAMPLIRYRTGDYAFYTDFISKKICLITSKWGQDILYGRNNEEISLTALNLHSDDLKHILRLQFIQEKLGFVTIRVSFSIFQTNQQIKNIENLLSKRVGSLIVFSINVTNDFTINSRGKIPLIINEIS
jgi:phenylacetate-CoA ligase